MRSNGMFCWVITAPIRTIFETHSSSASLISTTSQLASFYSRISLLRSRLSKMVIKKRQILWDWTNSSGPGNPGIPGKIEQVPFGSDSPVAAFVNWNAWVPPELKGRAPFHSMVRVLASTQGNDWSMIQNSPSNLILFLNEPERAGISPEQGRDIWYGQMIPLRKNKGKKLGSPAVASDDKGRQWIEKFMNLVAGDPPDFLCLHYYSNNADEAIKYIENMHNKWPKCKIMVTEIACIDRNHQAVLNFTVKICNWMDKQDYIAEYGLFDFQRKVADDFVSPAAQLMDANGDFTELGKMYVNQQPMKLPENGLVANELVASSVGADIAPDVESKTSEPLTHEVRDAAIGAAEVKDDDVEALGVTSLTAAAALDPDQQKALDVHNDGRKVKNLQPLVWDSNLAHNAETYAKYVAQIGKLEHSTRDQRPDQGENLAWASAANGTPMQMAANMWMGEANNYHGEPIGQEDFGSYDHYSKCRFFISVLMSPLSNLTETDTIVSAQCMWKSTTKLGMGWAKDAKGGVYIVGRYSPPGNFIGQKPYSGL
ncbi:glycoside hydrolase family 128 protein [Xylariaceae sp. FL1019]|nr:glycoside hydrolase family 128 protein [Xylariaceae sp. FL1019]